MSLNSKSKPLIKSFEILCLVTIVVAITFFVQRAMGRSAEIAERVALNAVDHVEEVITEKVEDRFEDVFGEGMSLARDLLLNDEDDDEDGISNGAKELPADRIDRIFRRATKVFSHAADDIMGLDESEETRVGRDVHQMISSQQSLLDSPAEMQRIERLAIPFLENRTRPGIKYRFFIVDSDVTNAFAHVGGYVYINRGLLEVTQDDDHALQFVLGHEIAHSDLRHCSMNMTAMVRADEIIPGAGSLAAIAYRAISLGYSEDHELESDLASYRQMIQSGRTHSQAMRGVFMLKEQFGEGDHSDTRNQRRNPIDYVEAHFRTHPPIQDRIDQLNREHARTQ